MPEATSRWKLGLFLLGAAGILLMGLVWLGAARLMEPAIPFTTYFTESVQGLEVGSPVLLRGVPSGAVRAVGIAPDGRHVEVDFDIHKRAVERLPMPAPTRAPPELRVRLVSSGLTGMRLLELDYIDPEREPPPALPFTPPERYVPSAPSLLQSLGERGMAAADDLPRVTAAANRALERVTAAVDDARVPELSAALVALLGRTDRVLAALEAAELPGRGASLLERLDAVAAALDQALQEADLPETAASTRQGAEGLDRAAARLARMTEEVERTLRALRDTLESVGALSARLERDPGLLLRGAGAERPPPERER